MKTRLSIIILFLFSILNCQPTNFKSEGYWIGIFSTLDESIHLIEYEKVLYDDTIQLNKVLFFQKDSMTLSSFNETLYYGFNEDKLKFNLGKDSLKINYNGEELSINYLYNNEAFLALDFNKNTTSRIKYIDYFTRIEEFGMSHKEKAIRSFLTDNPITINKRTDRIELAPPSWQHMGEFIQDSLEANYGYGNDWYFYTLEKELFLIIGGYLIHISEFDNEKIYGSTYNKIKSEIEIKKSEYNQKFNIEFLIGNWVVDKSVKGKEELSEKQKMEITDNKIIVNSKTYADTLEWSLNKYNNKILIKNDHFLRHANYWKIEKLSKNEMVVKRKNQENINPEIEILIFRKE